MLKLKNTNKVITLTNLIKDMDGSNECERKHFSSLVQHMVKRKYNLKLRFFLGELFPFYDWLKLHPEAIPWLIEKGYAEKVKPKFKPFFIEVKTLEEAQKLSLWNVTFKNLVEQIPEEYIEYNNKQL